MNAIQFIQQHGVEKAREVVDAIPSEHMSCYYSNLCYCTKSKKYSDRFKPRESLVNMGWLKRLVESVDIVNSNGGWNGTKNTITLFQSSLDLGLCHGVDGVNAEVEIPRLKQAIADYEAIGGEHV